jgi:hypothetical protein
MFLTCAGCVSPPVEAGEPPVQVGQIADARLKELSGIVASRRHSGHYYVHNDSGDAARVYLITQSGTTRLDINLTGVTVRDAEDIAIAPGATAGAFDVCLADIGDNDSKRKTIVIDRFPEPAFDPNGPIAVDVTPTKYVLRYADGPRNAEAFAVHPTTGDGYVFTKRIEGGTDVYRLPAPWAADKTNVLERIARLDLPANTSLARIVTAADIAPDGRRLVLRCYLNGFVWPLADVTRTPFEEQIAARPTPLLLAAEPQGEAICFTADNRAVLTLSEGAAPPVWSVNLAPAAE